MRTLNGIAAKAAPAEGNLCYTIAFDPPGAGGARQMARMLAGALVRTYFDGTLRIFRNAEEPLFLIRREGVEETFIRTPDPEVLVEVEIKRRDLGLGDKRELTKPADAEAWSKAKGEALMTYAMSWKHEARLGMDVSGFGKVLFLDADCLPLRNLDHLLEGEDWDILYQEEKGRPMENPVFSSYLRNEVEGRGRWGINSGTWAVRAEHYPQVMEEWARIERGMPPRPTRWTEQSAWNRLILDCQAGRLPWRARRFEAREIQFPLHLPADREWQQHKEAAVLHCMGVKPKEKLEFMFGMFMQKFYHDPKGTLLGILEM